jgi:hypothetical protein
MRKLRQDYGKVQYIDIKMVRDTWLLKGERIKICSSKMVDITNPC